VGVDLVELVLGAIVSLVTSFILVSRLERLGERFGLSEALLGVVAALAADAPEISSAVTALVHRQRAVGAGVVLGSNVFNLVALLGLGAVVAGWVVLHRRVVILAGSVSMWIAALALVTILGAVSPALGLVLALVVMVPHIVLLGTRGRRASWFGLPWRRAPRRWTLWVRAAVSEEE
jgi:cation:H+ antiporter